MSNLYITDNSGADVCSSRMWFEVSDELIAHIIDALGEPSASALIPREAQEQMFAVGQPLVVVDVNG